MLHADFFTDFRCLAAQKRFAGAQPKSFFCPIYAFCRMNGFFYQGICVFCPIYAFYQRICFFCPIYAFYQMICFFCPIYAFCQRICFFCPIYAFYQRICFFYPTIPLFYLIPFFCHSFSSSPLPQFAASFPPPLLAVSSRASEIYSSAFEIQTSFLLTSSYLSDFLVGTS